MTLKDIAAHLGAVFAKLTRGRDRAGQALLFAGAMLLLAAAYGFWHARGTLVTVAEVKRGDAAQVVYATGTVEPVHWAKIAALQRKRIVELCKCEGQAVKAGEVLARLDDGEERALLTELQARLTRLHADADRLRKLVERNVTSRLTYDEKLTQIREYEARVAAQKDRINDLSLKSPVAGIVLRRDGEVGEIAGTAANQVLFWVGQAKPLRIVAEVNEEDIRQVRQGQSVLLRHEGHSGTPLHAEVGQVTPKGDPQTKTFRVYLNLPQATPLMIGMSVEANIVVREAKAALLVPAEAVSRGTVQMVINGRAVRRRVGTGIRGTRLIEISSGASSGDVMLSPFQPAIADGQRVRPQLKATP